MSDATEEKKRAEEVRFYYLKQPDFKFVHVNGAVGSLTPRGEIQISFYTERFPIPQQVVHKLQEDGTLGPEIREERVEKKGLIRDAHFGIIMDINTARNITQWLNQHIERAEELVKNQSEKQNG